MWTRKKVTPHSPWSRWVYLYEVCSASPCRSSFSNGSAARQLCSSTFFKFTTLRRSSKAS